METVLLIGKEEWIHYVVGTIIVIIQSFYRFDAMSKKDLKRKADLCREYMIIFNILEPGLTKWKGRVCEELARTLIKLEGRNNIEALRLIGEAGKCKRLESQQEIAAFSMRISTMMNG